jgi:adenine-specific DNA-methyltransferase
LTGAVAVCRAKFIEEAAAREGKWLDTEIQKLDRWADDRKLAHEQELRDLDRSISDARRAAVTAAALAAKLEAQKSVRELEAERSRRRKDYFAAQDEVDERKAGIIAETAARMNRSDSVEELFSLRWSVS